MDVQFKGHLSWEKSFRFVYIMQKRLFKSIYTVDLAVSFCLQKMILKCSSSRLLAIRYVTQVCPFRKMSGNDGIVALSFSDRFELNESLKKNYNSWKHGNLRKFSVISKDGSVKYLKLSNVSDRTWQYLVKLAIEPAHEALFHPTNLGFRCNFSLHSSQMFLYYNLGFDAFGFQKRLLEVDLNFAFCKLNVSYLLKNLIAPRSIKLCLNRLLLNGFEVKFYEDFKGGYFTLSSLLANIFLTGVEELHSCIRFGSKIVFFLKPLDNESEVLNSLKVFLANFCTPVKIFYAKLFSPFQGFDFLGWHFKVSFLKKCEVSPSYLNYQAFLMRVKRIVNNSNFGSDVKVSKILPIVKDWIFYHKFSSLKSLKFSLFFMKKRAFKVFSKEARQDFYSSKRLLDKCFSVLDSKTTAFLEPSCFPFSYGHLSFGFSLLQSNSKTLNFGKYEKRFSSFPCIHCGVDYIKDSGLYIV